MQAKERLQQEIEEGLQHDNTEIAGYFAVIQHVLYDGLGQLEDYLSKNAQLFAWKLKNEHDGEARSIMGRKMLIGGRLAVLIELAQEEEG